MSCDPLHIPGDPPTLPLCCIPGGIIRLAAGPGVAFDRYGTTLVIRVDEATLPGVSSITGTANQVIAAGAGGPAFTGAVTLSLPQSIATTSNVQFAKVGIGVTPTRFLDVLGTTEQLRLSYDATTNFVQFTAASDGSLFIAANGTNPDITLTPGGTGSLIVSSATTTGVTGDSGLVLLGTALTSGTGFYAASSTLTSGNLVDLQVSGTAAAASQTALNILTTGANASAAITTYGAQISNTHTGTTSANVALYLNASGGASRNDALLVNAGRVGIGTLIPATTLEVNGAIKSTQLGLNVTPGSHTVEIDETAVSGVGLYVHRNLAAASTDSVLMYVRQMHASDDQTALLIDQAGSGAGLVVNTGGVTFAALGAFVAADKLHISALGPAS